MQHPLSTKVGTNVADRRRSLGIARSQTKATELYAFSTCVRTATGLDVTCILLAPPPLEIDGLLLG
jgi:hypothetical protein